MKNVIITGASSGLGLETAKKIAKDENYRIILACRNLEKAEKVKEEIEQETNNHNIEVMQIDTSLKSSVNNFVDTYLAKYNSVDVLINNAGISPMRENGMTEEGFEIVFATNYLGHFLLTMRLLEYMAKDARIINITSDMHNPPGGISWQGTPYLAYEAKDDRRRYSYSKLCLIYFTHTLNEKLKEQGSHILVNSFNPGYMGDTNFSGAHADKARSFMIKTTMPDRYGELATSSTALASVATSSEFKDITNAYFDRSTSVKESSPLSYNKENADELFKNSLKYAGLDK